MNTETGTAKHWIVDAYDAVWVDGVIVHDLFNVARVCMTCHMETGLTGPCLRENPLPTPEEITQVATLAELHEAARIAFGTLPVWMVDAIARGELDAYAPDDRRKRLSRARQSLAYAELHRRALDTE
ncbi:hypothetical protein OG478_53170 (plasmid) [Streptomyces phaeochromogenes]|uniref:hypothetical protein n=1 Tax=Streptomyces TaxID=1883 RepID=UPI0004C55D84|nr:hypothetical protein [Streptomyces sp. NRRL S-920]WST00492.1 hypothetical protein OG478_53170 [Streptomyces phaeochromogenes]